MFKLNQSKPTAAQAVLDSVKAINFAELPIRQVRNPFHTSPGVDELFFKGMDLVQVCTQVRRAKAKCLLMSTPAQLRKAKQNRPDGSVAMLLVRFNDSSAFAHESLVWAAESQHIRAVEVKLPQNPSDFQVAYATWVAGGEVSDHTFRLGYQRAKAELAQVQVKYL